MLTTLFRKLILFYLGARFDDRIIGTKDGFAPKAREAEKAGTGGIFQVEIQPRQIAKTIMPCRNLYRRLWRISKLCSCEYWI